MSSFLSGFFSKIGQVIAPNLAETINEEMAETWQKICDCSLTESDSSRMRLRKAASELLDEIKFACEENKFNELRYILEMHKIPSKLMELGLANTPKGFLNEVFLVFLEFASPSMWKLLHMEFMIKPMNLLIQSKAMVKPELFEKVIALLFEYVSEHPERIGLFILSDSCSPLIDEISLMLPSLESRFGEWMLSLAAEGSEHIWPIMTSHSKLISSCISHLETCIKGKIYEPATRKFLVHLDLMLRIAKPEFVAAFADAFRTKISSLLCKSPREAALRDSIYILTFFNAHEISQQVIDYVMESVLENLESEDAVVVYLSIRALTLIVDHRNPGFDEALSSCKYAQDVMSMVPAEWFVSRNVSLYQRSARSQVSMSMFAEKTMKMSAGTTNFAPVMRRVLAIFENFFSNSMKLNLAITELLQSIAVLQDPGAVCFAFAEGTASGMIFSLNMVCTIAKRRIGSKDGIGARLADAYAVFESGEDPTDQFDASLVILLEFLKEINSIIQARKSLAK